MQENTAQTRRFSLKLNHEIASDGAEVRLWLPLVLKTPYQYPISMYELSSNATKQFVCGELIPTYYAEFSSLEKSAYFSVLDVRAFCTGRFRAYLFALYR